MKIYLSAKENTEAVLSGILSHVNDNDLDGIEVARTREETAGLACEPTTIAAVLTVALPIALPGLLRALEKYLEDRKQLRTIEIVVEAYKDDPNTGDKVAELARRYSDVAISIKSASETVAQSRTPRQGKK